MLKKFNSFLQVREGVELKPVKVRGGINIGLG
jgi:hypothetical protein